MTSSFSLNSVWEKRLAVEVKKRMSTLRLAMSLPAGMAAMARRRFSLRAMTRAAAAKAGWP